MTLIARIFSMPYAQLHYPFENKELFEKNFPANFISEGIDQTRGWFYTLLVLSTHLFGTAPWRNLIVTGLVLAECVLNAVCGDINSSPSSGMERR